MEPRQLAELYLKEKRVMQLATQQQDRKLWACNVHFVVDQELNFYWLSDPDRDHSSHIKQNSQVAACVLVHEDTDDEQYVQGISVSGQAYLIDSDEEFARVSELYVAKFPSRQKWVESIASGESTNKFYVLQPSKIDLFDTKNFPGGSKKAILAISL
jgi:uncharacterized protein YhbP (UPF0306 family)